MTTKKTPRASSYTGPRPRGGRIVPDDACPTCGTLMQPARRTETVSVNGEQIRAGGVSYLSCPKCGEGLFHLNELRALDHRAFETYRKKYRLLSADDVRAIRERHGLTQAGLAKLLRLGSNTISRWEANRNVQTAAMDVLLRLIRDVPSSLKYLRSHSA